MIKLIPAIDLIDGKCVRLSQGDYESKKVYRNDPLEVAKEFEANGIQFLHLVDLDGARSQHIVNYKTLERITSQTSLIVDFGGGIKTDEDLKIAFECGAKRITGGSIAVKNPTLFNHWITIYGADKIILGADVKSHKIAIHGWEEESEIELMPFLENYTKSGITQVICTDVSKDGMLQGAATELYKEILNAHPTLHLIASGGVSKVADLIELQEAGVPAVIFGKAFYEGKITWKELQQFL